ncbi:hypothetical protein NDU88_006610 [Pleurodeles waltl]|uniref:Secreted protein n=1 Tax=Pleurodeles waltl TaxID=8319 RepID=A0AAV7WB57_PLEWA|nr:hypothetical protein NDU88_006610 [Pleurodeles waltl]
MLAMSAVVALSEHVAAGGGGCGRVCGGDAAGGECVSTCGGRQQDVSCSLGRLPTGDDAGNCCRGSRRASGGAGGGVQVVVLVARRGDSSPSAGGSVPCPDFPFTLFPFPALDVAAGPLALSPFGLEEALQGGWCGFSLRHMGTFFTLAGGGMG